MNQDQNNKKTRYNKDNKFPGFWGPNYTQVPDSLFDELLCELNGAELKVLLYIIRRTFGFKKGSDRISKSQLENGITKTDGQVLDYGTGLSRRAIRLAIDSLVEKGILTKDHHSSVKKGYESAEFALNILGNNPWVQNTQGIAPPRVQSTQGVSTPESTQGLGRGVPIQETVRQETVHTSVSFSSKIKKDQPQEAAELVGIFHKLAEHPDDYEALPKEYSQAKVLLAEYGLEQARFIVTYAVDLGRQKFGSPPETFGAISVHATAAMKLYEQEAKRRERQQLEAQQRQQAEAERIESFKDEQLLSPEERIERRIKRFPPALYPPAKLAQIRRKFYEDEGLQPPL